MKYGFSITKAESDAMFRMMDEYGRVVVGMAIELTGGAITEEQIDCFEDVVGDFAKYAVIEGVYSAYRYNVYELRDSDITGQRVAERLAGFSDEETARDYMRYLEIMRPEKVLILKASGEERS